MEDQPLTFAEIDRRIASLPEGPAAILDAPRWTFVFNAIGMAGIVAGLLPGLLVFAMQSQPWMAAMARIGFIVAIAGFALPFLRSLLAVVVSFAGWRHDQAQQLDHDLGEFRKLVGWIASQPREQVIALLEFCRQSRDRLGEKLAMLGGVEKLGLLPILVGVALHARAVMETIRTSSWEAPVGVFLVLVYGVSFVGNLMRQRLRLYEQLLERAVARDW
jgi:hypothetical protein